MAATMSFNGWMWLWLACIAVLPPKFVSGWMHSWQSPTTTSRFLPKWTTSPYHKLVLPTGPLRGIPTGREEDRDSLILCLDHSELILQPMLGVNREFRAPPDAVLPNAAFLDSILPIANKSSKRGNFHMNAPVHIQKSTAWKDLDDMDFSPEKAVAAAESTGLWSTGRHHLYPTTDQVAVDLPRGMGEACCQLATRVVLPALAVAFATPLESLYFKDMFLAQYAPTGQPGLGKHSDGSSYSFNMLLSLPGTDFEGGGTWIEPVGLVQPAMGEVLLHRGSLLHEGCPVTQGTRYVLVGFVQERIDDERASAGWKASHHQKRKSELLVVIVETFPLGLVVEVDEGDQQKCAMVVDVVPGGAAERAGIHKQDCLRGILDLTGEVVILDDKTFDEVCILAGRRGLGPLKLVVERWINSIEEHQ